MQFGIGHPPPTHQLHSTCVGEGSRVPNLQTEFNYLDLFKSYGIFRDFVVSVVPTLSPSSPHHPRHPHVIPVSSPLSPHHPQSAQKVPMWSPWLWSPWSPLVSMVSTPCCLRGPHGPHIVPVIPTSSPCHPRCPHIIPIASRRSSCGPHGCGLHGLLCCLHGLHPVLSPWSLSSPHCPRRLNII